MLRYVWLLNQSYPDVNVDIILPKDVSLERLKKNKVNFILGYDCINQILGEPYVRKFSQEKEDIKNYILFMQISHLKYSHRLIF